MKQILFLSLIILSQSLLAQVEIDSYENGQLKLEYDSSTHEFTKYFENGNIEIKGYKYYGLLHDSCKHYYQDGELHKFGRYYYGRPIGSWTEYESDGIGIKAWGYPEPNLDAIPQTIEDISEKNHSYRIDYPNNWTIVARKERGADFFIMPLDAFGIFKENLGLISQPNDKKYRKTQQFIDLMKSHYSQKYQSYKVLLEEQVEFNGIKGIDLICQIQAPNGTDLVFWSRCFMDSKDIYQLTLTCESAQLLRLTKDVEYIFNSFQFNK